MFSFFQIVVCVTQNKAAFFISHHTWEPSKKRRKDSDFLFIVQLLPGSFSEHHPKPPHGACFIGREQILQSYDPPTPLLTFR